MYRLLGMLISIFILAIAGAASAKSVKLGIVVETLGNPYFACVKRAAEEEAKSHPDLKLTVLGAATGFYYYFKIIRAMYWEGSVSEGEVTGLKVGRLAMLAIILLVVAVFFFGIFPAPLLGLTL